MHTPTDEQRCVRKAVVELLSAPRGIIKTIAGAGSGKTTTLVGAAFDLKKAGASRLCYLAFNKPLVDSGQSAFQNLADVKTFNKMAFEGVKVSGSNRKIGTIYPSQVVAAFDLDRKRLPTDPKTFSRIVLAIVSAFCQSGSLHIDDSHLPYWLKDSVVAGLASKYAATLFQGLCPGVSTTLSLSHEVIVKFWQLTGCPGLSHYDLVLLDEAQDVPPVLLSCLAYASRACYVGDVAQQLYASKGAQDSMLKVPGHAYRLSLSFRFGQEIAEAANKVIQSKSSPSVISLRGLPGKESTIGAVKKNEPHTRIFRTNAALIKKALNLTDLGATVNIVGDLSDIREKIEGAHLLLRGAGRDVTHPAFQQFKNWSELEGWSYKNPQTEISQIAALVKEYARRIETLVRVCTKNNPNGDIRLTTAHRAKGCEWDNVIIGSDFDDRLSGRMLNNRSKSPQVDEELNLVYVALTRTKKRLEIQSEILNQILK
jgi:superfamily I DNA/RNA helicase